jgi:glycosyltransferase involved in cell wall biosynthesis
VLTITNPKLAGPSIALCVIAKNEEEYIADCLDSARPFVDEIVVVDTGSTDRTVEIAREHGARIEHFTWINDFAAARNFAIEAATKDWILMLDADERLESDAGPRLKLAAQRLPAEAFGYCLRVENELSDTNTVAHYVTRLFPNRPDLRFLGAIHEELKRIPEGTQGMVIQLSDVRIRHLGYRHEVYAARNKDERNMRMLLQELDADPDNARLLYYVIQQHVALRRHADALELLDRFMAHSSEMRRAFAEEGYRMKLECLLALDRPIEDIEVVAQEAEAQGMMTGLGHEMLGLLAFRLGRLADARDHFARSIDPQTPEGLWGRPAAGRWETGMRLADVHWLMGNHEVALASARRTFDEVPTERKHTVAYQIAKMCIEAQRFQDGHSWLKTALRFAPDTVPGHLEVLDLWLKLPADILSSAAYGDFDASVAREDWQTAYEAALGLPLRRAAGAARVLRLAAYFTREGAADAGLDLLERLLDNRPSEPLVYFELYKALTALDRFTDAAEALALFEQLQGGAGASTIAVAA